MISGDSSNRLAVIAHHVRSEYRLVRNLQTESRPARHVGGRDSCAHSRDGERRAKVDRSNPSRNVRATKRVAP